MLDSEISLDNREKEREKNLDIHIVILNECNSLESLRFAVEKAKRSGIVDCVLLREFEFEVDYVLNNVESFRSLGVNIIMAPRNNRYDQKVVNSWQKRSRQFKEYGFQVEENDIPDDHYIDSVGLYIGVDGMLYAFPKIWDSARLHRPVHHIPGTNIGVTICGEINQIRPEDLEGVRILYNPSREGDDIFVKYRMLARYAKGQINMHDDTKRLLDMEENQPANVKERCAKEKSASIYIKNITDTLLQKRIPVVRCDLSENNGVLNEVTGMNVEELKYDKEYTSFHLTLT